MPACGKTTTLFGGRVCMREITHLLDAQVEHSDGRIRWFEVPPEMQEPRFISGEIGFTCSYCMVKCEALIDSEDLTAYGLAMCIKCRRVYKVEVDITEEWISA